VYADKACDTHNSLTRPTKSPTPGLGNGANFR